MPTADHPTPAKRPRPDRRAYGTKSKKEQKVHERYTTGDLEIVSSDGVCFRVNPTFLIAGSRVFRAMIEDGTSSQIQLTDEDLETEEVLINNFASVCPVIELINLAPKYDCPAPRFMIQHFLRSTSVVASDWAFLCFVGLSALTDVEGCAEAIRHGDDSPWDGNHGYTVERTDPLFFFALNRAARVIENPRSELSKDDLSRVADEFVRLLKPIKDKHDAGDSS